MIINFPNKFEMNLREELKELGYTKEEIKRAINLVNQEFEPLPPPSKIKPTKKPEAIKAKVINLADFRKAA